MICSICFVVCDALGNVVMILNVPAYGEVSIVVLGGNLILQYAILWTSWIYGVMVPNLTIRVLLSANLRMLRRQSSLSSSPYCKTRMISRKPTMGHSNTQPFTHRDGDPKKISRSFHFPHARFSDFKVRGEISHARMRFRHACFRIGGFEGP